MAMSVWPSRQARPAVSVTMTPTLAPVSSCSRGAQRARTGVGVERQQHDRAGRRRWRRRCRPRPSSARAGCARSTVGPRRATTRSGLLGQRVVPVARPDPALGLADHLAGDHDDVAVGAASVAAATRAARSAPVVTSGRPSGARDLGAQPWSRRPDQLDRGGRHRRGRVVVGHHQRDGGAGDPGGLDGGDVVGVGRRRPASRRAPRRRRGSRSGRPPRRRSPRRRSRSSIWWAIPRTWVSPTMGERPTTGAAVAVSASRMPGTPRIVPTETTGLDGGRMTRSASAIASSTPGAGRRLVQTDEDQRLGRHLGVQAHPVLLEVDDPLAARRVGVGDRDVGLDPVVRHRQQPDAPGAASAGTAPR